VFTIRHPRKKERKLVGGAITGGGVYFYSINKQNKKGPYKRWDYYYNFLKYSSLS